MPIIQPTWFPRPEFGRIRIKEFAEAPFFEEAAVVFEFGDQRIEAIVPSSALAREQKAVLASKVGELGDWFLVALPPSSISHPAIQVPKSLWPEVFISSNGA
jgi:hypothetical protein